MTDFSLFHNVQTGPGVHPASYSMDAGGAALCITAAEASVWPPTFIKRRHQEWEELNLHPCFSLCREQEHIYLYPYLNLQATRL
jgi:hypothetical protein